MIRKSTGMVIVAALSTAFLTLLCVSCSGNSENYAPKEPEVSNNPIGTFGAAGSTFIAPLFSRWSDDYVTSHQMRVNYRPIGSGAALGELKQGLLTFAATDAPLGDAELKDLPPLIQVPVTAGPVCVIYNVPGLTEPVKFSGEALVAIYSGQIKMWDEGAILRENPSLKLPHLPLTVVHRLDGSGTTSIFTSYLSAASQNWAAKPGHGLSVDWPTGLGENGSKAVLNAVKQTPGAVGYAELNYAKEAGLPVASVQNKAVEFIAPSPASAALAIDAFSDGLAKDLRTPIVDPPASAKGAYPITGLTFIVIPKKNALPGQQQKFKDFVAYCLTDGQNSAEAMSYTKLPPSVLQQGQTLLAQLVTDDIKPSH
ncbi:MAG TPA: phosphate ABC transporter substrate-binding protein PstS [Pseudacidobacterium sp.]|nr:phosphate ABC transporter substrate-binding protein PstS [Pseudacidobacterium sp.]